MQELVGLRLGDYQLRVYLGEGAHVHAFLAESAAQQVVIKILKSSFARTPELLDRFTREAEAVVGLKHPNLVEVYGYAQQDDLLYLVEEFKVGGSLRDIFDRQPGEPLPLQATLRTAEDIAAALDFAHERGLLHRDLKPENVLYDAEGNAALSDLGITKTEDEAKARTRKSLEFGNPGYMAPEVWQGQPIDGRTDNYALGIIVFQMLTGKMPFPEHAAGSMMYVHLAHLFTAPMQVREVRADLPAAVDAVVAKAIEKDPAQRYGTAGEFVAALKAALRSPQDRLPQAASGSPNGAKVYSYQFEGNAEAAGLIETVPVPVSRRPSPVIAAAAAILVAVIVGLLLGRRDGA